MIRSLEIRGLVVIDHAELELDRGLTVITGETGAGKTVLTNALGLLGVMPPDPGMVRPGHRHALIQATISVGPGFWDTLDEDDPATGLRDVVEDPSEFVVTRRIPADGRARSFVDGTAVPHAAVVSLVRRLVRFSGQGDQRLLTSPRAQRQVLDGFCGPDTLALAAGLAALRREFRAAERRHAEQATGRAQRERERADLEDLARQFDIVGPEPGEWDRLLAERDRLRHADRLMRGAAEAAEAVAPEVGETGARELVAQAQQALAGISGIDPALDPPADLLREAQALIDEAAIGLRGYLASLDAEPGRLDTVEARLAELERLARRSGCDAVGLADRHAALQAELTSRGPEDDDEERYRARQAAAATQIAAQAAELRTIRARGAPDLAQALTAALAELAMPDATVRVEVTAPDDPLEAESVEILLQPNAGLPEAPLADVASGGELSRVLLAVHGLAAGDDDATWIFDEIDAGIGGVTAGAVARRLVALGTQCQTVVITHLAQVAAAGDRHLVLDKGPGSEGVAATAIRVVDGDARVDELCRMLGSGADDPPARRHALDLLSVNRP